MIARVQPVKGKEPNEWIVEKFADIGADEPFVGRLITGLDEILGGTTFLDNDKKMIREEMLGLSVDCLMPAFLSLRELRRIARDRAAPVLSKAKNFDDMCRSLWAAYKDRMQKTTSLMGYDIGFLFQNDANFKRGCQKFRNDHPNVKPELIARMEINRSSWQPAFARYRNTYLEHKTMGYREAASYPSLDRAEVLFNSVWVSIEEILVLLMDAHLPDGFGLRELTEEERKQYRPMARRFGWRLTKAFHAAVPG